MNYWLGGEYDYAPYLSDYNGPVIPKLSDLTSEKFWFCDGGVGTYTSSWQWSGRAWGFANTATLETNSTRYAGPWMWTNYSLIGETVSFTGQQLEGHPHDTANFLFGDGHCETLSLEDVANMHQNANMTPWLILTGSPRG